MPYKPRKNKLINNESITHNINLILKGKLNQTNEHISINTGNSGICGSSDNLNQESIGGGVILHGNGAVTVLSGGATSSRTEIGSFGFSAISNIFSDSDDN